MIYDVSLFGVLSHSPWLDLNLFLRSQCKRCLCLWDAIYHDFNIMLPWIVLSCRELLHSLRAFEFDGCPLVELVVVLEHEDFIRVSSIWLQINDLVLYSQEMLGDWVKRRIQLSIRCCGWFLRCFGIILVITDVFFIFFFNLLLSFISLNLFGWLFEQLSLSVLFFFMNLLTLLPTNIEPLWSSEIFHCYIRLLWWDISFSFSTLP